MGALSRARIFARAARTTNGGLLPKASKHFWHVLALPDNKKQLIMKVRQGLLSLCPGRGAWMRTQICGPLKRFEICLLCPAQQVRDTQGHRLGGCRHPLSMARSQHEMARQCTCLPRPLGGHIGDCCMFTDAEGYEMYSAQSRTTGICCLPRWVLPFSKQTNRTSW